jgi:hypothetical protein
MITIEAKVAGASASKLISEKIAELSDWRGAALATVCALITEAVALNAAGKKKKKKAVRIPTF